MEGVIRIASSCEDLSCLRIFDVAFKRDYCRKSTEDVMVIENYPEFSYLINMMQCTTILCPFPVVAPLFGVA